MVIGIIIAVILFGALFYFGHKDKIKTTLSNITNYLPIESELTVFERELLDVINEHRLSLNLNFLKPEKMCRDLGEEHTKNMIIDKKPSHNGFAERSNELLTHGALQVGECVGFGYSTANSFIRAYLLSTDGHKEIIEETHFTHVGIRALKDNNQRYYNALIFAQFKK